MTDNEKLWGQVQEAYRLSVEDDEPCSFNGVVPISFSEQAKMLTLQVTDASEAICLSTGFGDPLVQALESLIGEPAFIECVYNPQVPKSNPKFTVRRIDKDYVVVPEAEKSKSALEMMLEDINDLKRRVSELELK